MQPITDTTYTRPLQCDSCDWQGDETQIHPDHGEYCPKCGVDGVYEPVDDSDQVNTLLGKSAVYVAIAASALMFIGYLLGSIANGVSQ